MKTYHEATITHCAGGFGEYQMGELGEGWDSSDDLLAEIIGSNPSADFYELGVDEHLPCGLDDIRGRIHSERGRIFGWATSSAAGYFSIVERSGGNVTERDAEQ